MRTLASSIDLIDHVLGTNDNSYLESINDMRAYIPLLSTCSTVESETISGGSRGGDISI